MLVLMLEVLFRRVTLFLAWNTGHWLSLQMDNVDSLHFTPNFRQCAPFAKFILIWSSLSFESKPESLLKPGLGRASWISPQRSMMSEWDETKFSALLHHVCSVRSTTFSQHCEHIVALEEYGGQEKSAPVKIEASAYLLKIHMRFDQRKMNGVEMEMLALSKFDAIDTDSSERTHS